MKASLLLIVAAVAVGGSSAAFAQADATGSDAAATPPPGPEAGSAAPAAAPGDWGQLDSRPLILPKGRLAADAILPLFGTSDGSGGSQLSAALQLSGTYGVIDKLQVGVDFSLALAPSFNAGELGLRGAYAVLHSDKMDFAAAAEFNFGLNDSNTVELDLGAWFRYRIAPKMMLFTGQPTTMPITSLGFGGLLGALGGGTGPVAYQFAIGLNNGNPFDFALPVGFGYQVTPQIWAYGQLLIMNYLSFSNVSQTDFIFADFIPITIGGFYTINDKMEAGLSIGDDLEHAGDLYAFTFNFRYWVK